MMKDCFLAPKERRITWCKIPLGAWNHEVKKVPRNFRMSGRKTGACRLAER